MLDIRESRIVVNQYYFQEQLKNNDPERDMIIGDGNFSAIIVGATGSGKDSLSQSFVDVDMNNGRTIIIIDIKMEYPSLIFMQQDPKLQAVLNKKGMTGKSYPVDLWIPYTNGLETNEHFKKLLKCAHPRLRIRPFRILTRNFDSTDSKTGMLGFSKLQTLVGDNKDLQELLGKMQQRGIEAKEQIGKKAMIIDDYDIRGDNNPGWEYMNFEDLTRGNKIHVISTYFMMKSNTLVALSSLIGILTELLSRAMDPRSNTFSVYIPEMQILQPKGVKSLEDQSKLLKYKLLFGFLLLRSFYARPRINLQNLSALDKSLFSQSKLYIGKTTNPDDIDLYRRTYRLGDKVINNIKNWPPGKFYSISDSKFFSCVGQAHKAMQRQPFVGQFSKFYKNPKKTLYPFDEYYISDIMHKFHNGPIMNVKEYNIQAKRFLKKLRKKHAIRIKTLELDKDKAFKALEKMERSRKEEAIEIKAYG